MYISDCCSTRVAYIDEDNMTGICFDCKEGCEAVLEEESEFTNGKMD